MECTSLKFPREICHGDINLDTDTELVFKGKSLSELTNEGSADKEREDKDEPWGTWHSGETSEVELKGAASNVGRTLRKDGILIAEREVTKEEAVMAYITWCWQVKLRLIMNQWIQYMEDFGD